MDTHSKLFSCLAKQYLIGSISEYKAMYSGYVGDNLILTSSLNKKYFLKKYSETLEGVATIHKIISLLKERGASILLPIMSASGSDFFIFEEGIYALFPFIDLPQYKRGSSDIPDDAIISMGKSLAKIHLSAKDIKIDTLRVYKKKKDDFKTTLPTLGLALEEMIDSSNKDRVSNLLALKAELFNKFKDINIDLDHIQLGHGDYHIENAFYDSIAKDFIVFDFDKAMYLPIGLELFKSAFVSFYGNEQYIKIYIKAYAESNKNIDLAYVLNSWKYFIKENVSSIWTLKEILVKKNYKALDFIDSELWRVEFISKKYNELSDFIQSL